MTSPESQALIAYRLEQSRSALRQARLLLDAGEPSGAVNRGYYAMFYSALALLLSKGLGSGKHSGVLALVDREFVRLGLMAPEMSAALRDAFNQRQRFDYAELTPPSEAQAQRIVANAGTFLAAVIQVLARS